MADRKIDEFATLDAIQDDDLLLVSSESDTYNVKGSTLKKFVKEVADAVAEDAATAKADASTAKTVAESAEAKAAEARIIADGAKTTAATANENAQAAQTAVGAAQVSAQTAQAAATSARASATQAATDATNATNAAESANSTANEAMDKAEEVERALQDVSINKDDLGLEQDEVTGYVYPTYKGERSTSGIPLAASGGGGGSSSSTIKVRNLLANTAFTVPYDGGCVCELKYSFESKYNSDNEPTGNGTAVYYVGGAPKLTETIAQGEVTRDIGPYLTPGKANTVRVVVTDQDGNIRAITYTITVSQNYITSTFPAISKQTGSFQVAYTPVGSGSKTIKFEVDGEVVDTAVVTSSNRVQYKTFDNLEHGAHIIKIYMETVLEGYDDPFTSNVLTFGVASIDAGNDEPILLVLNTANAVSQYDVVSTKFIAYNPTGSTGGVACFVDDEQVTTLNVSNEGNTWDYTVMSAGEHTLKLVYGELEKVFTITAAAVTLNASAETEGLKFYFTAANRSNDEPNPAHYSYTNEDGTTYDMQFNGVQFTNDGWTGKSLKVRAGASVTIPYQPFANDISNTVGKTIELNFKVSKTYDYSENVITCFANSKGITIKPNDGSFAINGSDGIDIKFNDETDIRLSFVIANRNTADSGKNQLIYVYINGDIVGIIKYGNTDNFSQFDAQGITIGSTSADIELYNARCYEVALSAYGIVDNYIVDSPDPQTMIARDNRNNIFDDTGEVDYDKLPDDLPYIVFSTEELPQYKGDKKSGVSGRFVDKANPDKSFTFEGAQMDVQGTSSAGYFVKNFKVAFKGGFTNNDGENASVYALTDKDVPVDTFTFKADVASSEGANNVILMRLWENTTPYKTPPQLTDSRVRQTINCRPIAVFWEDPSTGAIQFWGKYNFNNDKGTPATFGFVDDAEHKCQCWDFRDNGLLLTEFKTGDFTEWETAFEAIFPKDFTDTTRLQIVVSWVASTNVAAATNNNLASPVSYDGVSYTKDTAEYRLAKFKAEFEDYFVKDNALYYYIFTELFLMVDSRAKNIHLATWDGLHWVFLPYDGDTALGINNIGALKFDYYLEDGDTVAGNNVFNGQESVLFTNIVSCFEDDIVELITSKVESSRLSYNRVAAEFNNHQAVWGEAIFCADTQKKYIEPYLETSDANYLNMAQGSKRAHRDYWLKKRLAYEFAKYHIVDDVAQYIMFRMTEPNDSAVTDVVPFDMTLKVTPYIRTYVNVTYGGQASTSRQGMRTAYAQANEEVTLTSPLDAGRDSTVYVFSAPFVKSIGDLSPMYPQIVNISAATNLEELIIGNGAEGYKNQALTELGIGNNTKLRKIDIRNCVSLAGEIAAGNCDSLEEFLADGSSITSVVLPSTGNLKRLRLPASITTLTLANQQSITEFNIEGYDSLTALYLDDCPSVDALDVLAAAGNLTNVYLANVDWSLHDTAVLDRLLQLGGIKEGGIGYTPQSVITGRVHVPSINTAKLAAYREAWGTGLEITYDTFIPQYPVKFYDYDGTTLLYTEYVNRGENVVEPIGAGYMSTPTRPSSVETVYTFNSWSGINFAAPVAQELKAVATYDESVRTYTVMYKSEGEDLLDEPLVVAAHGSAAYSGTEPVKADDEAGMTYYLFDGWDAAATDVVSDMVINARFATCALPAQIIDYDAFCAQAAEEGFTPFLATNYNEVYPEGKTGVTARRGAYTLEEYYAICKSPLFKQYFTDSDGDLRYGDKIEIWFDENNKGTVSDGRFTAWVNGFNHFERADGTGMAHVSMDLVYCLNQSRQINTTNTNVGGWYDPANNRTAMRNWLNNTLIKALPTRFQQMLTRVNVVSSTGNGRAESYDITTAQDKLYLLSQTEIFGGTGAPYKWEVSANAETKQLPIYQVANNRIKRVANADGSAASWWTRSPSAGSSGNFVSVNTNGSSYNSNAINSGGVAFGFSIG